MPEQFLEGEVVEHIRFGGRLRILRVAGAPLEFTAGQFTKIGLPQDGDKPLMRAYSFVNTPGEQVHEFFYDVLDEGEGVLTPLLDRLEPGDRILLSERTSGLLVLRELPESAKRLFLIATGTGIGPFLSILSTEEPWGRFERVALVSSVRQADDLVYRERIAGIAARHPERFVHVPLVTREDAEGARRMRVTELLTGGGLAQIGGGELGEDCQFMMCGNPEMIREMGDLLKERGFERNRRARPGNVTIEKYWS